MGLESALVAALVVARELVVGANQGAPCLVRRCPPACCCHVVRLAVWQRACYVVTFKGRADVGDCLSIGGAAYLWKGLRGV